MEVPYASDYVAAAIMWLRLEEPTVYRTGAERFYANWKGLCRCNDAMHDEYLNSATSTMERCLKRTRDQNFQLFMSVDVKNSSGVTFMPSSVWKVVVGKREGEEEHERIKLRGENGINTFAASYLNTQGLNNSCFKSLASTLVDLTFQSRALRSFSLNQLRNLSL